MSEFFLKTPVLLIIFNRPETTQIVFEAIRKAKPAKLYVAADGPRRDVPTDAIKCAEARKIVERVDWPCEVKCLFHEQNLNCGKAPSTAMSWLFKHEEEGIILEDDCLPSQSFFRYCQELLEKYRDDSRIMHIGGNNFLGGWQNDREHSYYFSRSGHIWGWATWRRAWQTFDIDIRLYEQVKKNGFFENFFLNRLEKVYRIRKFEKTVEKRGNVDWWDYQWDFARFVNSGLAIVPNKNLVRNLGFGRNATHTVNGTKGMMSLQAEEMEFPLKHPSFVIRDFISDKKYFSRFIKDVVFSKLKV
jgi:hypothetical protein